MTPKSALQGRTVPQLLAELKAVDINVQALFDAYNSNDLAGSMLIIGSHQGRKFHEVVILSYAQPEVKKFLQDLQQNYYHQKLLLTKELADREKQNPLTDPPDHIEDTMQLTV